MVKLVKISDRNLTRSVIHAYSIAKGILQRPGIRSVADIVITGTTGVGLDTVMKTERSNFVDKQRFGQGRATNISEANKKYTHAGRKSAKIANVILTSTGGRFSLSFAANPESWN